MTITIHQPECFPWLGFFHKMCQVDTFVLLDTVQFEKNYFQNRNRIKVGDKAVWLTIPLKKHPHQTLIKDIKISWSNPKLFRKHLSLLKQQYAKYPYFKEMYDWLNNFYANRPEKLSDFNEYFIRYIVDKLNIKTKILKASELSLSGKAQGGTEVNLEISKIVGADCYLSGVSGKNYLDENKFEKENIEVKWHKFKHPIYKQTGEGKFISNLSILDAYFNHGPKVRKYLLC